MTQVLCCYNVVLLLQQLKSVAKPRRSKSKAIKLQTAAHSTPRARWSRSRTESTAPGAVAIEESCGIRGSYGVTASKTAEYCAHHAPDGMVNVCSKKCRTEGCGKQPSYGMTGTTTAEYCTRHVKRIKLQITDSVGIWLSVQDARMGFHILHCGVLDRDTSITAL